MNPIIITCVHAFLLLQVVHSESQENGQKEAKKSRHEELEEDDLRADGERTRENEEKMDTSFPGVMETQSPLDTSHDAEINTGNKSITRWSLSGI